jgi:hypothetical protein
MFHNVCPLLKAIWRRPKLVGNTALQKICKVNYLLSHALVHHHYETREKENVFVISLKQTLFC